MTGIISQIVAAIVIEVVVCFLQWKAVRRPAVYRGDPTMADGRYDMYYETVDGGVEPGTGHQADINDYLAPAGSDVSGAVVAYVLCGIIGGLFFVYLSLAYSAVCTVLMVVILLQYLASLVLLIRNGSFEANRTGFLSRCLEFFVLFCVTLYTIGAVGESRTSGTFAKLLLGTDGQWHRKFIDDFGVIIRNLPSWQFIDWLDAIQLTVGSILCVCFLVSMLLESVGMFVICGGYVPLHSSGFVAGKTWVFTRITTRKTVYRVLWFVLAFILSSRSVVTICVGIYRFIADFISNSYTH
ncbi:hypothetical protein [Bifidobacterium sp. ESL0800]|uniref:hypothetical protein n=1 Tax=Bifidobacterium sp. ESL0800 TaxID=2983236 RepID=UPI0023F99E65|nr:hypothetical protein [Bifidobacterium sp. ESL0800]WEV76028.1 hypothetical protein OZX75_02210 [Bifidobacterium sp. ESL0800]